jgi:hypothetical protein
MTNVKIQMSKKPHAEFQKFELGHLKLIWTLSFELDLKFEL